MNPLYLLLYVAIIAWIYWVWSRRKFYALLLKIPGPMGYPILGMSPQFIHRDEVLDRLHEIANKYGPIVYSWLGPYPFIVVNEPVLAQEILTSPDCVNKSAVYKALDNGTGNGLFSLKDPTWSMHRKHLNPAFSHKVLLSFFPIFNEETNGLLKTINMHANSNESFDLLKVLKDFTLNVATRTTMGQNNNLSGPKSEGKLLTSYHSIVENMTGMILAPWLSNNILRRLFGIYTEYEEAKSYVQIFIRKLIEEKLTSKDLSAQHAGSKQLFIHSAIDLLRRGIFTWKEVEDESNVIVIGAFETTATTIYHALILLAMFPAYQDKVFEELLEIFPEPGDIEVSYSNMQDMVYLDMVLNESMRVITPVPIVARETSNDVRLSNGIVIPSGIQVAIYIHHIHRRVDIWGADAHLFNPEHFLPSNMEAKHPYAFMPFTKGIRNCIGWRYGLLSAKLTLAKILRNYTVSTDFLYSDLVFIEDIVMKLKKAPILNFQKRTT